MKTSGYCGRKGHIEAHCRQNKSDAKKQKEDGVDPDALSPQFNKKHMRPLKRCRNDRKYLSNGQAMPMTFWEGARRNFWRHLNFWAFVRGISEQDSGKIPW
jgi:hypothetical protein